MMFTAKNQVDNFRENLKSLCAGYGAVTSLAQHLGIHRVTMSKIVNGHGDVTMDQAQGIAGFYGVELSDLLLPPSKFRKSSAAS